jgi:Nucleotide-binding protein implicated in inhibition of septum formation
MIPARWILASASPRRRALITLLRHPVEVLPVEIDESPQPGETPPACAARLARAKVEAARLQAPEALILAADTVVDLEGQILGKPADARRPGRCCAPCVGAPIRSTPLWRSITRFGVRRGWRWPRPR